MRSFATPQLGEVRMRGWKPATRRRMGQIDWTPVEAEAWLEQTSAGLRLYPGCANRFVDRARQIVDALKAGAIQYDALITITDTELSMKSQIDKCLVEQAALAEKKAETTQVVTAVAGIAGLALAIGVGYWLFS